MIENMKKLPVYKKIKLILTTNPQSERKETLTKASFELFWTGLGKRVHREGQSQGLFADNTCAEGR